MKVSLFDNDRGVSPVIGVILMVAITVLLAATAAVFFLDFQDQTSDGPPSTAFDIEYEAGSSSDKVTIGHSSGDSVTAGELEVVIKGADSDVNGRYNFEKFKTTGGNTLDETSKITAGDEIVISKDDFSGVSSVDFSDAEITVVWTGNTGTTRELSGESFE